MAKEIISQILAPDNAPYINGVAAQRLVSPAILENMFQSLVEKDGRGVNDNFVKEQEANESAQIIVHRIVPVKMKPREQGASKNGASFSANAHYTQTETVGIDILTTVDDPIIIPRARQDQIKVDLLAQQVEIYSKRLATIINGMTCASKLIKTYDEEASGKEVNVHYLDSTDPLPDFLFANALLDEGDIEHGIDVFPTDSRVAVFKMAYRPILKAKGILTLGGANYLYDIVKNGGLNPDNAARTLDDGYWGDIDNVPVHGISNESLRAASGFLGLTENDLKASHWVGYISSSYANARGVSTIEQVKIVDAIAGQGLILQPYSKMGAASWYAKGNVLLNDKNNLDGFVKDVKTILTTGTDVFFRLKAEGSRLYPTLSWTSKANAKFTLAATAEDDFSVDHVFGTGAYVVAEKPFTTVSEFLDGYHDTDNEAGTFTVGQEKTFTTSLTAGKYCSVLVVSDDGSFSLAHYAYAA